MPPSDAATPIQACLNLLAAGDPSARDELIRVSRERLLALTRRLMARFSALRRWIQSDDVLQVATLRLCRTLEAVPVSSTADFVGLAALNIRRELLDLVDRHFGPWGLGCKHETPAAGRPSAADLAVATRTDPSEYAAWRELHGLLEELPADEQQVVYLRYYLGMTHAEVAAQVGVSERTVKRRFVTARLRLRRRYRVDLDDSGDFSGPPEPRPPLQE